MTDWVGRLRDARTRAGLSQRALARRGVVPPSTVQRIEAGQMSPTVEMLDRLLAAADTDVVIHLVPTVDGVASRTDLNESERRSLAFGVLTAQHVLRDPVAVLARARTNLTTMRDAAVPANMPYLDAWQRLLEGSTSAVIDALVGDHQDARDLRQATPFAGVVPDTERRAAIRRLRAA